MDQKRLIARIRALERALAISPPSACGRLTRRLVIYKDMLFK